MTASVSPSASQVMSSSGMSHHVLHGHAFPQSRADRVSGRVQLVTRACRRQDKINLDVAAGLGVVVRAHAVGLTNVNAVTAPHQRHLNVLALTHSRQIGGLERRTYHRAERIVYLFQRS